METVDEFLKSTKNRTQDGYVNGLIVRASESMDSWFAIYDEPNRRSRWHEAKVPKPARPSLAAYRRLRLRVRVRAMLVSEIQRFRDAIGS